MNDKALVTGSFEGGGTAYVFDSEPQNEYPDKDCFAQDVEKPLVN